MEQPRFHGEVIVLGVAGTGLILGAFLPWVSVAGILNVTGVSSRYGMIPVIGGVAALVLAIQAATGRLMSRAAARWVGGACIALGVLSMGAALYVGFEIRQAVANGHGGLPDTSALSSSATPGSPFGDAVNQFGDSLANALKPAAGNGVYVSLIAGAATAASAVVALGRHGGV